MESILMKAKLLGMRVTVRDKQSVFDIALQEFGAIEAAFDIALKNGISVTSKLNAGAVLIMPKNAPETSAVLSFYKDNSITPATDIEIENTTLPSGNYVTEGYWSTGYTKTQ